MKQRTNKLKQKTHLQAAVVEGRAALHHRLDVDAELVLADALGRHDAQPHAAVGLGQPDQLHLGLLLPLLLAAAVGLLNK